MRDDSGHWVEGTAHLNPNVSDYFAGLFSTEIDEPDPVVLQKVVPKVTDVMNDQLMRPYDEEEVKKALFSIGDMKAPGMDGLHTIFFKKNARVCWDSLTKEVLDAVNHLVIVRIPKVEKPELVTQYRPVSLCNMLYKVISKMIALRLKHVLDEVISPTQSAFVPGRLITDNIYWFMKVYTQ